MSRQAIRYKTFHRMDTIDWEGIYPQLLAFSDQYMKKNDWFRGKDCDSSIQGKQADDYVQEAIADYLYHPEKFKPEKGSLVKYLKFSIIRRQYSNDANRPENTSYRDVFGMYGEEDEDDSISYAESILPFLAATFDEQIDYVTVMLDIEKSLQMDSKALKIFHLTRKMGYKRREVIADGHLTEDDFDSGMKRLNRILEKIEIKYSIKKAL